MKPPAAWITRGVGRIVRLLRPDARNSLAVSLLLTAPDRAPRPVTTWAERRVLVLAPHADDESIGCGGTLAIHARAGASIRIAIMTDGAMGDRRLGEAGLTSARRQHIQQALIPLRRQEAEAAGRILGASEVLFFDGSDGALSPTPSIVRALAKLINEFRPQLIYLPFVMDLHPDHWQTSRIFNQAIHACGSWKNELVVRGYEVWSPLVANRVVDITDVVATKHMALAAHASQLSDRDYATAISGLNRYRSIHLDAVSGREAEAFFESSARGYQQLISTIEGRHDRSSST